MCACVCVCTCVSGCVCVHMRECMCVCVLNHKASVGSICKGTVYEKLTRHCYLDHLPTV